MKSQEELEKVRQQLLNLRRDVVESTRRTHADALLLGGDGVADLGDMSANSYSQDVLVSLNQTQRDRIRDIDAALKRVDEGVYGICIGCEEPIAPRRLEVRPFSRYCIDCKKEFEQFGE